MRTAMILAVVVTSLGQSAALQVPEGWRVEQPEKAARCSAGKPWWMVERSADGGISMTQWQPRELSKEVMELLPRGVSKAAVTYVLRYRAGWLVAVDRGEWPGGGLWLLQPSLDPQLLLADNVRQVVVTRKGTILAFDEIGHLNLRPAVVYQLSPEHGFGWSRLELPGVHAAAVGDNAEGEILVASMNAILVHRAGKLTEIGTFDVGDDRPTSVATDDEGAIFIGLRGRVLRLTPTDGRTYTYDWLVPVSCDSR